jgi:hypothetical protein
MARKLQAHQCLVCGSIAVRTDSNSIDAFGCMVLNECHEDEPFISRFYLLSPVCLLTGCCIRLASLSGLLLIAHRAIIEVKVKVKGRKEEINNMARGQVERGYFS